MSAYPFTVPVNCKYGAPMGRPDVSPPDGEHVGGFVQLVPMVDGDYDQGGAYWGGGGVPLYCAYGVDWQVYVRAATYKDACAQVRYRFPLVTLADWEGTAAEMTAHYIACSAWVDECDVTGAEPSEQFRVEAAHTCRAFLAHLDARGIEWRSIEPAQLGHSFFLSRNGHGAGFFDFNRRDLQKVAESFGEHVDEETQSARYAQECGDD